MAITIDEALQRGISAHREGNIQEAERFYQAILQSQPSHPDANHNLGLLAVSVNKFDAALPLFKTALDVNPKIEQFWLSYIDALVKGNQFEKAKEALEQAAEHEVNDDQLNLLKAQLDFISHDDYSDSVSPSQQQVDNLVAHYQNGRFSDAEKLALSITEEYPKHPFAYEILGAVLGQTGRKTDAVSALQIAVALSPQEATSHYNLGVMLKELDRLDEAEASYEQATALNSDFTEAHSNLGNMLRELGRLDEAETSLRKAIASKSDFAEAHSNLGVTLKDMGRLEEAEASLRTAIVLKSDFAEAHSNLGITLRELGRSDEAEVSYGRAIECKPDYVEAHYNLGITLKELGRSDEAEASYRRAIKLQPSYVEAHNNLGNMLRELDRLDEAEASYQRAIEWKPNFIEAHYNLGLALQKLGRLDEAEASYQHAIALNPDYAEAHYDLGNMLRKQGRFHEAEESYKQAIILKSDLIEAHNNLGNLLRELGRLDEAEASCKQAIALKPDFPDAYCNLGSTLQELGRLNEAESSYKQAIVLKPDFADAFWNSQGIQKTLINAEHVIDQCLNADASHMKAKLTKAALRFYRGDRTDFEKLLQSEVNQHPYMRTFSWAFNLPNLPELHFNRWYFFDAIVKKSVLSRPFYEFGVWRALSFKYLIGAFKKGYGFDTFTGLPEDWVIGSRIEKKGTYSSDGNVPDIEGGEFIVGKFEDTLPAFFSESRPIASVINFDADLYSSTICALNCSKSVIDKDTILIFDQFIINDSWEQDEFRALNEFCSINDYSYEVVAISFFTKQVAVKLLGV
tara:strand:+ start:150 stop:2546 length:2397 start_codon:yes stop_codon:yes gene_type:complete